MFFIKTTSFLIILLFLSIFFPIHSQSVVDFNIQPIYINPDSVDDIREFNLDSIPPYIYTNIPDLSQLDVATRKKKFIELILPAILYEKARVKKMYNMIDDQATSFLYDYCNCETTQDLYYCLSEQPNSIIIAQAAIESGWGTSRFFLEGFNLFGIHSFYSSDIKIKAEGSDLSAPVFVKKYDGVLSSVSDYLRTLAKSNAYSEFRIYRFHNDSVKNLLVYLEKYSIRRDLYIKDLEEIIEYNNLFIYDNIEVNWK